MELKLAIGDVLDKFDISGLEAEDIDEALELVEEVDAHSEDEAFWEPCLERVLGPVRRASGGGGDGGSGLAPLQLETRELAAARAMIESGDAPTEERPDVPAGGRLARAGRRADGVAALGRRGAAICCAPPGRRSPDASRSKRRSSSCGSDSRGLEEARAWDRARHRLIAASARLWLEVDRLS